MAALTAHFLHSTPLSHPSLPFISSALRPPSRTFICCSSSPQPVIMNSKFMELPYVSAPLRDLMVQLVSSVETRLGSSLLPCTLPPDVQFFENPNGSAQASLHIRSGDQSSLVDFILGSWIHSKLPSGGNLNIVTFNGYMKPLTDAPNFVFEIIWSSPTSLVLLLDLPPRTDLILHPEYLKTFYEDTQLDRHRQLFVKLPEVKPYISPDLYIRTSFSPTAIVVRIEAEVDATTRMEEIIQGHLSPVAKEILEIWLDLCACADRKAEEDQRAYLEKRDEKLKKADELASSFPKLFGQEVATRVVGILDEFGLV